MRRVELFTDNLAQTIAGTNFGDTLGSFTVTGAGVSLGYTSPTLTGSANNLAAGATVTITYSGTVAAQSVLNGPPAITTIDNTVVPSGSTTCETDCTTDNPLTPKSTVAKSVTVNGVAGDGASVKPGDVLAWTITVKNTGSVAIASGQLFTDNLAQTIAGTNFGDTLGSFTVTGAGVSLDYTSPTLTGSANNLAAGATVTVTYSGTVLAQSVLNTSGLTTIDNTVVPSGSTTCDVDCTTNNPLTPHLTLVKNVVSGSTGLASSPDWTLTATDDAGSTPINDPGITNTTGPGAEIAALTTYALSEGPTNAASEVTDGYTTTGVWSCVNANAASTMDAATNSVSGGDGADITCTITNTYRPVATATKTVSSTVENDDGSWTITYDLVVTNPDTDLAATYSLSDTPAFGTGMTITGAAVTMPDGTAGPAWDGSGTNILATDRPLAAGATETWTIALTATIASTVPPSDTACSEQGTPGFGFFNSATITTWSGSEDTSACSSPVFPTLSKSGGFRAAAPGQWLSGRQLGRHLQDQRHQREQHHRRCLLAG